MGPKGPKKVQSVLLIIILYIYANTTIVIPVPWQPKFFTVFFGKFFVCWFPLNFGPLPGP